MAEAEPGQQLKVHQCPGSLGSQGHQTDLALQAEALRSPRKIRAQGHLSAASAPQQLSKALEGPFRTKAPSFETTGNVFRQTHSSIPTKEWACASPSVCMWVLRRGSSTAGTPWHPEASEDEEWPGGAEFGEPGARTYEHTPCGQ